MGDDNRTNSEKDQLSESPKNSTDIETRERAQDAEVDDYSNDFDHYQNSPSRDGSVSQKAVPEFGQDKSYTNPVFDTSNLDYIDLQNDEVAAGPSGYGHPPYFQSGDVSIELDTPQVYDEANFYQEGEDSYSNEDHTETIEPEQDSGVKVVWWRQRKWWVIGVLVFLVVAAGVAVPTVLLTRKDNQEVLSRGTDVWIGCPSNTNHGKRKEAECVAGGCTWRPSADPWPSCFLPEDAASHYKVVQTTPAAGNIPIEVQLQRKSQVNLFGSPHESVTLQLDCSHANRITVRILPEGVAARNKSQVGLQLDSASLNYSVEFASNDDFNFKIIRKSNNQFLWDSSLGGMILEKGFLQVGSRLPSPDLYGMGQNGHGPGLKRHLDLKTWPLFNRDSATQGKDKLNMNSFHPFYLNLEESGEANGVLFRTLQASEYILMPEPGIVFRTIDSYLEFVIFVGDSPMHVSQLLSEVIGGAPLPPYWALGLHFQPSGYPAEPVTQILNKNIPLDAVHLPSSLWAKDMVMDLNKVDSKLSDFVKDNRNISWIITLSPALVAGQNYEAYEDLLRGTGEAGLMSWHPEVTPIEPSFPPSLAPGPETSRSLIFGTRSSKSAVDYVGFVNFEYLKADLIWQLLVSPIRNELDVAGFATVSNSPTNLDTNREKCSVSGPGPDDPCWLLTCPDNQWEKPAYVTSAAWGHGESGKLSDGTVCMSAGHVISEDNVVPHLHLHNYYGMKVALATLGVCSTDENRCLVFSESTAYSLDPTGPPAGSVVKFLDPVESTWEGMKRTLHDILEFNLLGLPLVGADICGSSEQPDERLCVRWIQLGAFYPVIRARQNQQLLQSDDLVEALQTSVLFRYTYLNYFYSTLYLVQTRGEPLLRPLFYQYTDEKSRKTETQFMIGPAMMVAPIFDKVTDRAGSMEVYLPKEDEWYRIKTNVVVKMAGGQVQKVDDLQEMPVFVRAGHILPCLDPQDNIEQTLNTSLILRVFPRRAQAEGFLYADDGTRTDPIQSQNYYLFHFTQNECELTIRRDHSPKGGPDVVRRLIHLGKIVIYNWEPAIQLLVNSYVNGMCQYHRHHRVLTCMADIDLKGETNNTWVLNWETELGVCVLPRLPRVL